MKTIYIITGPTAVGKTSLALKWAEENDAEIVSCDSLLFYKGMDIGTAKPTKRELDAIPHHCIDLVEPDVAFNIAMYLDQAEVAVKGIFARGKNVLVTGGSGFYLKGFVAPVVDGVKIPQAIEEAVDHLFASVGLEAVVEELKRLSPDDYNLIDLHNSRRVVPALKRCKTTGLSVGELRTRVAKMDYPFREYPKKALLLQRSVESLENRIRLRTKEMLNLGFMDEVKALLERGIEQNPSACHSIGYREVIACLKGELAEEKLESTINLNTRKLVKKQLKWFRNQIDFQYTLNLDNETPDSRSLFALNQGAVR